MDKTNGQPTDSRAETKEAKNSVEVSLATGEAATEQPKKPSKVNWEQLKSLRGLLKLGQVICGILILALIRPTRYSSINAPEYAFIFVTYNVTFVTLLMLVDSLVKGQPLRKIFTPPLWDRFELWFTGLVALAFHILGYLVLVLALNYYYYHSNLNTAAGIIGFIAAVLYLVDWWRMFRSPNKAEESEIEQVMVE